jgi:hypothetical protein
MSGRIDLGIEGVPPIIVALIIVLAAVLAFELAIPRLIASRLENAIQASVESIDYVRVCLRSFPAINLISSGKVNSVGIDCKGLFIEGLRIESVIVDASDILIDMKALREESRFSLSHIGQGQAELVIGQDDLNRYVSGLKGVPDSVVIELSPGRVVVKGDVSVAGIGIPVSVDGKFVADREGTRLGYEISDIHVGGARLPSIISDGLMRGLDFSVDMSSLPVPVIISDISMEDKIVRITGRTLSHAVAGSM